MRQYLLARRAVKGLSCKDLFQGPGNVAQPCASSDRSNHDADSFVCAAKCLHADPDSQAFGLVEADILARLHSPHQQTLHPGRQFIVGYLGLCDRRTKQGMLTWISDSDSMLLDMDEKVDFRQWLTWAIQLTEAVDYLHNTGLVHHDIKPHNILLDSNLTAKLSDFGAGRFLPKGHGQLRDQRFSVEDGLGRGTPPYSAPEMFASSSMASEATYGPAIDIYSLGVSLYVIGLTAQEPFHKLKSTLEMIVWIRKGGFWLWEDQGWVHDRGPVPKVTMATRQSSMPSATQSPTLTHINVQNPTKSYSEKMASGRIASTARPISLASLAPAPIDTHIVYDGHWTSGTTTMSSPQPMNTDDFIPQDDSQHRSHSPTVPPFSYRGQGHSHLNHFQHMAGPSPDPVIRTPMLPTTPVSPVPLPSPIIRAQALRSSSASTRREEPQPRRSGETVMRFLNGEVVQHEVVQLLKDMCHPDVDRRPDSSQVLARLRELERMTMDYQEE
ncbi:hypothetical protein BGW38_001548 [Lunasporangiospora selenospora]|uniref:Protein kinase domain-containing protein n=1 Tax=Lunasporangiospora selenospora TaxID=979761 RepID=A0A9P6FTX8_9FUNG|nr:hypothetical protein BGW38_001548 [Lunasporangiospora selenospora]